MHAAHLPSEPLPVNDLAAAYQPRRIIASILSIALNLSATSLFVLGGGAARLDAVFYHLAYRHGALRLLAFALCALCFFIAHALLNYPLELWFGYLEERQFGLAKGGIRAWSRDWLAGISRHGIMFITGSVLLLGAQAAWPTYWLAVISVLLLLIFLLATRHALALLPRGLFQLDPIDPANERRLRSLLPPNQSFPKVKIFSASNLRDFSGGLIGLGSRQALLLSRSTLTAASDNLLHFILLHELGHRRHRHVLLSVLTGWAWIVLGLCAGQFVIARYSPTSLGHPSYLAWLALTFSLWMALGEPLLAYLGRRLEYQADRHYLRHGGHPSGMRDALHELSARNLARTEGLRRRHTIFHPLPSVWNRLHAARQFVARMKPPASPDLERSP